MTTCVPPASDGVYVFALPVREHGAANDSDRPFGRRLIVRTAPSSEESWAEIIEDDYQLEENHGTNKSC